MGLINIDGAFPNFTKCSTWKDIKESHSSDKLVELRLHDVYGMLILLSIGLLASVLGLAMEKAVWRKNMRSVHPARANRPPLIEQVHLNNNWTP